MGADLLDAFKKHAIYDKSDIISGEAIGFEFNDNLWNVITKTASYKTRTIIYAAGAHHRKLKYTRQKKNLSGEGYLIVQHATERFSKIKILLSAAAEIQLHSTFFIWQILQKKCILFIGVILSDFQTKF